MHRILTTVLVTGALVGGGAAIANAASSTATTPTTTSSAKPTAPARAPSGRAPRSGAHHCPGMGSSSTSSSAPAY